MNAKKIVTAGLALVMVAGISVAGTLAFLTDDTGPVTNTFTVGAGVAIALDEAKVGDDGKEIVGEGAGRVYENDYNPIPGGTYDKDPTVHVTGDDCFVFVKVTNEISGAEATDNTIANQILNKWTAVSGKSGVYFYDEDKDGVPDTKSEGDDCVVFENFSIKSLSNDEYKALNGKRITVTAFAIQAENMDLATATTQLPTGW